MVHEVGRLLDNPFVRLVERRDRELDRLLTHLAGTRADAGVEQRRRCTSRPDAQGALRRSCARVGREARRRPGVARRVRQADPQQGSRRRRSRREARRPRVCFPTSPFRHSCSRDRLENHASFVSRVRRSASSFIHASIRTLSRRGVLDDRGASTGSSLTPRSHSSLRSVRRRAGFSCRIEASSAACATSSASATCDASPAPPEAITGTSTAAATAAVSSRS